MVGEILSDNQILLTKPAAMRDTVMNAPLTPGCYIYRDSKSRILYIGKAKVLRKRVSSYFANYFRVDPKIQIMIDLAQSIEYLQTDSEIEALILETNLIKKYKPKYNTLMVDDKNYMWVRVDRSDGKNIPTLQMVRRRFDDKSYYFGPYPDTAPVRRTIERLRKILPFCTNGQKLNRGSGKLIAIKTGQKKPCFHYHLGYCKGICADLETRQEYLQRINQLRLFFLGKKNDIVVKLTSDMQQAAKNHNFEKAAILRDRINDLKYVATHIQIDQDFDEAALMLAKQKQKETALTELVAYLQYPNLTVTSDFRIECYDISNIQGTNAVGAMTVMVDGKVEPKLYRKFRIRMKNEPNDFAMLQEMLFRRFYHFLKFKERENEVKLLSSDGFDIDPNRYLGKAVPTEDESLTRLPNLIVIDGGKGQLSSAFTVMRNFGLNIPMIGLAKREEEVFAVSQQRIDADLISDSGINQYELEFTKIHIPRRANALHLLQQIRDEAHRFGITYHRLLRTKQKFEFDKPAKK